MSNSSQGLDGGTRPRFLVRLAQPRDMPAAAGLILSDQGQPPAPSVIADFLNLAPQRSIDLSQCTIAEVDGRIAWAAIPVISPGRTMLLLMPSTVSNDAVAGEVIEQMARTYAGRDVHLAQVLADPDTDALQQLLARHRFVRMAELIYLQTHIPRSVRLPKLNEGLRWVTYSSQTHALFLYAILESYKNSLDCPGLNGMRDIEDVIKGHRATGDFNPELWFTLCRDDLPLGVLLLSPLSHADAMELVYLGLSPDARGQGLGNVMMQQALAVALHQHQPRLTLAVDSINAPALKLYYRSGMERVMSKVALIRDLRRV